MDLCDSIESINRLAFTVLQIFCNSFNNLLAHVATPFTAAVLGLLDRALPGRDPGV